MFFQECEAAVQHVFGSRARLKECITITDSARNFTAAVRCDAHESPLFFKLEKPFVYPRMQKFQIAREVAGLRRCAEAGVPVPKLIGTGETSFPWLLEEFLPGAPISQWELSDDNRREIGQEFAECFEKLCGIRGSAYGDTFSGGFVGRHKRWKTAMTQMTRITFEDCLENDLFGKARDVVDAALQKALEQIEDQSPPTFFHCDLFSPNIMGDEEESGKVSINGIIDFGMSLYAPLEYVRHMTGRYCDLLRDIPIASSEWEEEELYQILRIEPLLMMKLYGYPDTEDAVRQYVEHCSRFLQ